MKKMKLSLASIAIFMTFAIIMSGCSSENIDETALKSVDELRAATLEENPMYNKIKNEKGENYVIISARLHSNYPACTKGWGFCDLILLNKEVWHNKNDNYGDETARKVFVPVVKDVQGLRYAYVYINEDVSAYSDGELVFDITSELYAENDNGDSVMVLPAIYELDRSMGEFGGYKVKVQ